MNGLGVAALKWGLVPVAIVLLAGGVGQRLSGEPGKLHQAIDGGVGRTEWDDDGQMRLSGFHRCGTQEDRNAMINRQVRLPKM